VLHGLRCTADPPQRHGAPTSSGPAGSKARPSSGRLTPERYERYELWFDNARRLRQLSRLEDLSRHIADTTEGWQPET
jgi:hypothetical protein